MTERPAHYEKIGSQRQLASLLEQVNYLHDALLHEAALLSRGYVAQDLRMFGDVEPWDARLVFQIQSKTFPVLEFVAEEVIAFVIMSSGDFDPSGTVTADFTELSLDKTDRSKVIAKRLKYRFPSKETLGRTPRIISEIPVDPLVRFLPAQQGWYLCTVCRDIWQASGGEEFIRCPTCGALGEIGST